MTKTSDEQTDQSNSPFAALPSVSFMVEKINRGGEIRLSAAALTWAVSESLDSVRKMIAEGYPRSREEIVELVEADISRAEVVRLRPIINATGVIIHTNLGRTPVSDDTASAMARAASSYVPLEIEPETNERGGRMSEISVLIRALTGAESAMVVNNNAAAVLLVLSAVASGGSVIVSRGEAIEIGGGFRIPDVMKQSGAKLVEVGTTNRTYLRDYDQAIDETTAALLKVHPSNFKISGFTRGCTVRDLAFLADSRHIPVIEDLGSGALIDTSKFGLSREPTISESLEAGVSIVTASGDKLIGGPQAGVIAGTRKMISNIERHPLARAVRADKTCLAGVAATLRHYANGDAVEKIPVWKMISTTVESLQGRADLHLQRLAVTNIEIVAKTVQATIGGGSLPGQELPSVALAIPIPKPDDLAKRLRTGSPAVFGRIENGEVIIDLRTVLPEQDDDLRDAILQAVGVH